MLCMYRDDKLFPGALKFNEYEFDDACRSFLINFLDIADSFLDGRLPSKYHERYHRLNISFCRHFGIMSSWGNLNRCRINLMTTAHHHHWWLHESPNEKPNLSEMEIISEKFSLTHKEV